MFGPHGRPRINRAQLAAKAGELDRTIRQLTALRRGLLHAAACPAPSHMECPTLQRMLRLASADQRAGAGICRLAVALHPASPTDDKGQSSLDAVSRSCAAERAAT